MSDIGELVEALKQERPKHPLDVALEAFRAGGDAADLRAAIDRHIGAYLRTVEVVG